MKGDCQEIYRAISLGCMGEDKFFHSIFIRNINTTVRQIAYTEGTIQLVSIMP
jgi:DNA-binding protein